MKYMQSLLDSPSESSESGNVWVQDPAKPAIRPVGSPVEPPNSQNVGGHVPAKPAKPPVGSPLIDPGPRWSCLNPYCLHKTGWWMSIHHVVNCLNCCAPSFPELIIARGDDSEAPFVDPDRCNQALGEWSRSTAIEPLASAPAERSYYEATLYPQGIGSPGVDCAILPTRRVERMPSSDGKEASTVATIIVYGPPIPERAAL
jgi:hypothetical protein